MKFLLFLVHLLMVVLLMFSIKKAAKKTGELTKTIVGLNSVAIVIIIFNCVLLLTSNKTCALICANIYYLCFDWLTLSLLLYTEEYTKTFHKTVISRTILFSFAAIDSISFIFNIKFHHIFDLQEIETIGNMQTWLTVNKGLLFDLHLTFSYVVIFFIFLSLVVKIHKTQPFYRKKYQIILVLLCIVIFLNAIFLFTKLPIDISLFLYSALAAAICYYSLFYKPKSLIDNTLALVVTSMNDAVLCFDLWGNCLYANSVTKEMAPNHDENIFANKLYSQWVIEHNKENRHSISWEQTEEINGETRHYYISYRKLFDKKGIYIGCFFTISDRTEEVKRFKESHYRMTHDTLTGLYNSKYFFECVAEKLKISPNRRYFMVCSNIKGFKLFNELFGLDKGDEVLVTQANLIKNYTDSNTICGRISGDEFAIFLEQAVFSEKIFYDTVNILKEKFNSNLYNLHIIFGVYEISNPEESVSIMLDKCKIAIESFKGDYNTFITYYDQTLLEKSLYERKIVSEFDKALNEGEFKMFLQPQYSPQGNILGAEALVRWQHPIRGMIYPSDFIEIFEKTGIIHKLDFYIWETAAKKLSDWKKREFNHLYISVNISAKDFYYMDVYEKLTYLVNKYDIDPKNLKLELTETALMTEINNPLEIIQKLRSFGFLIEIDDFGSGYSSLNMLKDIDVDVVKIDMGFLQGNSEFSKDRSETILDFIISMIKKLGIEVITEGVESKEHIELLTKMNCDIFQGFYFSKPISVSEFEKSLD